MITHEVPSKPRSILSRALEILTDDENSNYMVIISENGFITDLTKIVRRRLKISSEDFLSKRHIILIVYS